MKHDGIISMHLEQLPEYVDVGISHELMLALIDWCHAARGPIESRES